MTGLYSAKRVAQVRAWLAANPGVPVAQADEPLGLCSGGTRRVQRQIEREDVVAELQAQENYAMQRALHGEDPLTQGHGWVHLTQANQRVWLDPVPRL